LPTSLPHSPDGIGIAVVDTVVTDEGWRLGLAIPGDLHGPNGILQGGFSAALARVAAAHLLDGHNVLPGRTSQDISSVRSRLRRPTPVNALLYADVERDGPTDFEVRIRNGDEVTVTSWVEVLGPPPVPLIGDLADVARMAVAPAQEQTGFPLCFVCGASSLRGLHLAPRPIGSTGLGVTPWIPDARVDDGAGAAHPLAVAAVLDCPGVWAGLAQVGNDADRAVALLGEFRIQWFSPPRLGREYKAVARVDDSSGSTLQVRTALFDELDKMCALVSAVHVFAPGVPAPPTADRSLA
jgi:acyl-coenzyme A thioesterase PaaI-like protein